ncbi:TPA: hypothetical protein IP990_002727 [Listeria monocytogenes]|nr:hypothetical protein [Listeria monocytogenes]
MEKKFQQPLENSTVFFLEEKPCGEIWFDKLVLFTHNRCHFLVQTIYNSHLNTKDV